MISRPDFRFDPTKDGEAEAKALLDKALGANPEEAMLATEALIDATASLHCWRAVEELAKRSEGHPDEIARLENALIVGVAQAKPEEAEAYLRTTIERCRRELKNPDVAPAGSASPVGRGRRMPPAMWHLESALTQMAALPGPTADRIAFWGRLVRESPDDLTLARAIVIPLHQNRLREGWEFAHPDLPAVLEAGARHSDRTTREFTYRVYLRGLEVGGAEAAATLGPSLKAALDREEDATLVAGAREKLK
jgi:hypothetical protein